LVTRTIITNVLGVALSTIWRGYAYRASGRFDLSAVSASWTIDATIAAAGFTLRMRSMEGSVIAQDVTVCGRVKGTIRAVRVKLQDGGAVEGDIFHRSLSIDENFLFEGSSRRVENPTDPSSVCAKGPQKQDMPSSALAPYLQRVEESASTEWSDSAVEPKH
jgi:hypothetical protein